MAPRAARPGTRRLVWPPFNLPPAPERRHSASNLTGRAARMRVIDKALPCRGHPRSMVIPGSPAPGGRHFRKMAGLQDYWVFRRWRPTASACTAGPGFSAAAGYQSPSLDQGFPIQDFLKRQRRLRKAPGDRTIASLAHRATDAGTPLSTAKRCEAFLSVFCRLTDGSDEGANRDQTQKSSLPLLASESLSAKGVEE